MRRRCRARCARRSHYCARVCQVLRENCVLTGERALAPNHA
jgi:hypothetical protein